MGFCLHNDILLFCAHFMDFSVHFGKSVVFSSFFKIFLIRFRILCPKILLFSLFFFVLYGYCIIFAFDFEIAKR